jgi:hypothetical protein
MSKKSRSGSEGRRRVGDERKELVIENEENMENGEIENFKKNFDFLLLPSFI